VNENLEEIRHFPFFLDEERRVRIEKERVAVEKKMPLNDPSLPEGTYLARKKKTGTGTGD